jgi:hypothetical protein
VKISKRIKDAVKAGVAYLDAADGPDWPHQIDVNSLNLQTGCGCVLGQIERRKTFGAGYDMACARRGLNKTTPTLGFWTTLRNYPTLTAAWKQVIRRLQRTRPRTA